MHKGLYLHMTNKHASHRSVCQTQRGFTLIEILIVLLMTAVALMALGTFSVAMMDSGTKSRERLLAVHLAEQVIEEWQVDKVNDFPPVVQNNATTNTCEVLAGSSTPTFPFTQTCKIGAQTVYTVKMTRTQAQAPLPKKPNNNNSNSVSSSTPSIRNMIGSPTPYVKAVTVSWTHKGVSPDCLTGVNCIYLTHLTRTL